MTSEPSLEERLNHIETVITDPKFRTVKGLGNDIPYYIFDYSPENELIVRAHIQTLVKKINESNLGFKIVCFDLFELIYKIIEEKGYAEKCARMEQEKGSEFLAKALTTMLRLTSTDNPIVTHIKENSPDNSIVFLTGVGKSYPIIRAHNILNNLQQVLDTIPVVMFYPGKYTGQELQLFGTMKDDNYYRAFPFPRPVQVI